MNNKSVTFITLNGLLQGMNLDEIHLHTGISETELVNSIGFDSIENFRSIYDNLEEHYPLKEEEHLLLNFLNLHEYNIALLENDKGSQLYGYNILYSLAHSKSLELSAIPNILLEYLPTIKSGKKCYACDGSLYLPPNIVDNENTLNNLLIDVFNMHFFAKPLLNARQVEKLKDNLTLAQAPSITPSDVYSIIHHISKKGYKLSAINDLLGIPLYNYVDIFSLTGAVMDYDNGESVRVLSYPKNTTDSTLGTVMLIPSEIITTLVKAPRLFEECYIENGYIYIKTNVGYKQLILHKEVSL